MWNDVFCSDPKKHRFGNSKCRDIIINGIFEIYNECVPALRTHYIKSSDDGGWASFYCMHNQCCDCQVCYTIKFLPGLSSVEVFMETNGTRNHYRGCIRSRPVRGEARFKTREMLEFIPAAALRDKHYDQLTTAQRVLGSHVSVPSAQAYRKIKSESKPWKKSLRWEE